MLLIGAKYIYNSYIYYLLLGIFYSLNQDAGEQLWPRKIKCSLVFTVSLSASDGFNPGLQEVDPKTIVDKHYSYTWKGNYDSCASSNLFTAVVKVDEY